MQHTKILIYLHRVFKKLPQSYPIGYPVLKYNARSPVFTGIIIKASEPLSPPVEKQMNTNPTKFNDLAGFFRFRIIKLFIKSQNFGVFRGVSKLLKF
ncbi:hypothetical protein DB891_04760 [Flavobacterium laiguense]|uniref:Uncharacterized protein n=1 Tax=Flavobacterium laiguense TaxID=2169409 RepID=A0A2U1JZ73_9FLAO|nr:hypothetical protein DB891_04760 [Flavobacterium laiguense]